MVNYKALSDIALVDFLKQDDEKALSALYLRYWDKLFSVACHRLNAPEEAEEVVQDIFFRLWENRHTLELKYTIATYLAVAVKYRVINLMDHLYRKRNRDAQLPDYSMLLSPSPEDYTFEKELRDQIEGVVGGLPEKCQIVFRLSREEYLTNKQIAETLDISEKTVEAHISKALRELRGSLAISAPGLLLFLTGSNFFSK